MVMLVLTWCFDLVFALSGSYCFVNFSTNCQQSLNGEVFFMVMMLILIPYAYYLFAQRVIMICAFIYDIGKIRKHQTFSIRVLRTMNRIKVKNYLFHPEKECLQCWEPFKDMEVVTVMRCAN